MRKETKLEYQDTNLGLNLEQKLVSAGLIGFEAFGVVTINYPLIEDFVKRDLGWGYYCFPVINASLYIACCEWTRRTFITSKK